MSHEATNWAIKQRGLKPATKILLWHLCDRHNPDFGCFPSIKKLSEDCEISERSVQTHIDILVELGLVRVESGGVRPNGTFKSNRYILRFEDEESEAQNLPTAKSAYGKKVQKPSANSACDLRQNLPTNPVRVNPVKEPYACGAQKKSSDGENLKRSAIAAWIRGKRSGISQDWLTKKRIEAMQADGILSEAEASAAVKCLTKLKEAG